MYAERFAEERYVRTRLTTGGGARAKNSVSGRVAMSERVSEVVKDVFEVGCMEKCKSG